MKKRGQLALKPILESLLAVAIIAVFLMVSHGYGTQEFPAQARLVRDGASQINTLQSFEGNMLLKYPGDMSAHVIAIDQTTLSLVSGQKPFHHPVDGSVDTARLEHSKELYFYKNGKAIGIASAPVTLRKLNCRDVKYKADKPILKVTQQTADIAMRFFFKTKLEEVCNAQWLCAKDNSAFNDPSDLFIQIMPMEQDGVVARYPADSEESRELACAFLNNLDIKNLWLLPDSELQERAFVIEAGENVHEQTAQALQKVFT